MMRDPRHDPDSQSPVDMRPASWWFVLSTLWGQGYYALAVRSQKR